jgi:integrase
MAWTKKAPNGKWKGCWRDHTGQERSKTFATKTEALKYARKMEVEVDSGVRRDHDLGKWTFADWWREYMETSHARPGTMVNLDQYLRNHILPTPLAKMPLDKIRPMDVDRWVANRLKAGISDAQMRQVFAYINVVLNRAADREVIPKNPARHVDTPEYEPKPKVVISDPGIMALSEAVIPRYRALILVLGFGGLRIGEAAGLTPKDFDEEQGYLWITRQLEKLPNSPLRWAEPKSRNRKKSPSILPDFVVPAVREHIEAGFTSTFQGETLIFSSRRDGGGPDRGGPGDPLLTHTARRAIKVAAKKVGIPPAFRTHNLRDSCATNMLAEGASVQDVADQLGDNPVTVLHRYIHSSPESRRAALSRRATRALPGPAKVLELPAPVIEGEVVEG